MLFEEGMLDLTSPYFTTLLESRMDFLKQKFPNHHALIDLAATEGDPTPNKKYTEWLVDRFIKGDMPTSLSKVKQGLQMFSKAKSTAHDTNIKNHTVQSMLDTAHIVAHGQTEGAKPLEKVYESEGVTAFKIPNKESSIKHYGPGSKHPSTWCTAANSVNNRFDTTTGDKVTMHFPNGKYIQFNHESAQLKDSNNQNVDLFHHDYKPYYSHIKKVIKDTVPTGTQSTLVSYHFPEKGDDAYYQRGDISNLSDAEFNEAKESRRDVSDLASNPSLKPDHAEKLFHHAMSERHIGIFDGLLKNPNTPQSVLDNWPRERYSKHHQGYSAEKLHSIINGAVEYHAHTGIARNHGDAYHLEEIANNEHQQYTDDHIRKIASIENNITRKHVLSNVATRNEIPYGNREEVFHTLVKRSESGFGDNRGSITKFLDKNPLSYHQINDALSYTSKAITAVNVLHSKNVSPNTVEHINSLFKKGNLHIGDAVGETKLDHEMIKDYLTHPMSKHYVTSNQIEDYAYRKDADVNTAHKAYVQHNIAPDSWGEFYDKKLPVDIITHPIHMMNVVPRIDSQKHLTKDDLHTVLDKFNEHLENKSYWPSTKTADAIIDHPNSNVSHYEKLMNRYGKRDGHFREVLYNHSKVPDAVKAKWRVEIPD